MERISSRSLRPAPQTQAGAHWVVIGWRQLKAIRSRFEQSVLRCPVLPQLQPKVNNNNNNNIIPESKPKRCMSYLTRLPCSEGGERTAVVWAAGVSRDVGIDPVCSKCWCVYCCCCC